MTLNGLVLLGGLALLGWVAAEVWIHLHLQRLCVETKHSWTAPRDGVRWCRVCGRKETGR